jgi:hypothetical protein
MEAKTTNNKIMSETNSEFLKRILPSLAEKMPFKWRVQSFSKNKPVATCVAYIDARDVMDRLDKCCYHGWERLHQEIKGHVYSGVSIVMPDGSKLTRWDCGVESNTEAEKGESSDSFKRAAVNWGVGRFLYDLEILYVDSNEKKTQSNYPHVVDANGKQVWDITKHCNSIYGKKKEPTPPKEPEKPKEIPQITEAQKQELIKFSSLTEILTQEQRTKIVEWVSKPQTFEAAKKTIEHYTSIINSKMQPA